MLASALFVSALLLMLFHHIKQSLSVRHARRIQIQNTIREFAIANRVDALTLAQIEDFWVRTSEVYWVCGQTSSTELRNELHYHSLILVNTRSLLEGQQLSDERQGELLTLHTNTVQWFSASLVEMDSLFNDIQFEKYSVLDLWNECLRRVSHSIRA